MIKRKDLESAIYELENGKANYQNSEKLATFYTLYDHLYSEPVQVEMKIADAVGEYGDTDFLTAIANKDAETMWLLMDELMDALKVLNPRLYESVMQKMAG